MPPFMVARRTASRAITYSILTGLPCTNRESNPISIEAGSTLGVRVLRYPPHRLLQSLLILPLPSRPAHHQRRRRQRRRIPLLLPQMLWSPVLVAVALRTTRKFDRCLRSYGPSRSSRCDRQVESGWRRRK